MVFATGRASTPLAAVARALVAVALAVAAALPVVACGARSGPSPASGAPGEPTGWTLDRSTFDPSADPCDDFYQYTCGGWERRPIPADRTMVERERDAQDARAARILDQVLAGTEPTTDPDLTRLRAFHAACMVDDRARDRTTEPALRQWLARIDAIATMADLQAAMRELQAIGVHAWFDYSAGRDPADRGRYRGELANGELGLRIRELADASPAGAARRDAYRASIARMFELAGEAPDRARRDAAGAVEVEIALAAGEPKRQDLEDPSQTEHAMTPDALRALAPHVDWDPLLAQLGAPAGRTLNVQWPRYLEALDRVITGHSLDDLRAALRWRLLDELDEALPAPLADEAFRFHAVPGLARPGRAQECRLATLKALGVELSRQFSRLALDARGRATAIQLVAALQVPIIARVTAASWLSPDAQAATAAHVRGLDLKLGYPDTWPQTGSFPVTRDHYFDNVITARRFEQARIWRRAHAAWSRSSWEMTVYPNEAEGMAAARLTIPNGYPDLASNSIILPAAELVPPLFDPQAPREVQYATLGALVGHETGHVLDIYQFDAEGLMRDIWSPHDVEVRAARRACIVAQADQFAVSETAHVDGTLTAGENVADLAGIEFAYAAAAADLGDRMSEVGRDGLTRAQRFFIAYAQRWCLAVRPETAAADLRTDPHAPARFRVDGPLANLPAFAAAFSCRAGARMARPEAERCTAW